jgi:mannose/fructose/N-acetylgalactosamine-specific phosphotransferase system component IIC
MRGGEAVSDPRDAALAAEYAENARLTTSGWLSSPLVFRIELALFAILAVIAVIAGRWALLAGIAIPVAFLLASRLTMRYVQHRIDAAAEQNRRLAEQFEGTSEPPGTY